MESENFDSGKAERGAFREKVKAETVGKHTGRSAAAPTPFPVAELGPKLERAVWAIEQKTQAPTELGVSSVLAALTLAAQSVGNVVLRSGSAVPLSLYLLAIAESTERKSSVDKIAMSPVKAYESVLAVACKEEKLQYDAKNPIWTAQYNFILKNKNLNSAQQEQAIKALGPNPVAPKRGG